MRKQDRLCVCLFPAKYVMDWGGRGGRVCSHLFVRNYCLH